MRKFVALCALIVATGCAGPPVSSAQQASSPGAVVATVNGEAITADEVRSSAGPELARLEEQVHELQLRQLDLLIETRLLEAEARRRGTTREALEAEEIAARITPVTEEDVARFIAANRQRINGDPEALRPQIRQFLASQQLGARRAAFVGQLREAASVTVSLAPPPAFRATLDLEGAPVRGAVDAPVTIVEFSDFHCPFCRSVQPTLNQLLARYEGKVRLVYKHLPLDVLHPQARRVSEASWCAGQQGRFWEFHDVVYQAGGTDASDAAMLRFAADAGVDPAPFTACLAGDEAAQAVARDVAEGKALDLNGTPGFFVNGRELRGAQPLEAFVRIIEDELARP
jgi:protein-disulfide isomerase